MNETISHWSPGLPSLSKWCLGAYFCSLSGELVKSARRAHSFYCTDSTGNTSAWVCFDQTCCWVGWGGDPNLWRIRKEMQRTEREEGGVQRGITVNTLTSRPCYHQKYDWLVCSGLYNSSDLCMCSHRQLKWRNCRQLQRLPLKSLMNPLKGCLRRNWNVKCLFIR